MKINDVKALDYRTDGDLLTIPFADTSVEAVLAAYDGAGAPRGGYVANIQGDLAVSANKRGVRVEPMAAFRARRKRG